MRAPRVPERRLAVPALRELQAALGAAVRAGPGAPLDPVAARALVDPARLEIHRNHFYATLADALCATFPVVRRLVGDGFFRQAARAFVRAAPPTRPCLFEYGAGFADFLAGYPPAAGLVYLADVARLEWAMNEVCHAPEAPALAPGALGGFPPETLDDLALALHPLHRLLASPYPVDRIWRLNQGADEPEGGVDLDSGGVRLLIRRAGGEVELAALGPGDYALLGAIDRGLTLGPALELAAAAEAGFDPGAAFFRFIRQGALCAPASLSMNQIISFAEETPS